MWADFITVFGLFMLSATKFMMAPAAILATGYSRVATIIITFLGGTTGSIFFFKVGSKVFSFLERYFPKKERKKFTRKNRLIIRFKNKFGVIGLAFLIPLISIPISALLAAKYFRLDKKAVPAYTVSAAIWSIALTFLSEPVITLLNRLLDEI